MPMSLPLNLLAPGFLTAGPALLAHRLDEGKGPMPKGRDRRAAAVLLAVSAALFLAAGGFLMSGDRASSGCRLRGGPANTSGPPRATRADRGAACNETTPPDVSRAVSGRSQRLADSFSLEGSPAPWQPHFCAQAWVQRCCRPGCFDASMIRGPGTSSATRWATARHHRAVGASGASDRWRSGISVSRS